MATQQSDNNTYGVLGGLPVAEQTQDYFLVFKDVGGTGPEIINNTAYFIEYVVDYEGELSKPSSDSVSRLNVLQNFPLGKTAIVRVDNASNANTQLSGELIITGLGTQKPILYTQYGIPSSSYTTNISFTTPEGAPAASAQTANDILSTMVRTSSYPFDDSSFTALQYYDEITVAPIDPGADFSLNFGTHRITSSFLRNINSISYRASYNIINNSSRPAEMIVRLTNTSNSTASVFPQDIFTIPANSSRIGEITATIPKNYLPISSLYPSIRLQAQTSTPVTFSNIVFSVTSTSPPPPFRTITNYWSTGSDTSVTWLTASSFLSLNYGNIQDTTDFAGTGGSFGLSPINDLFTPRTGDRIRFEYDPSKDFYIYDVIPPQDDPQGLLKIKLNQVLPEGTILDNFIIHRVDNEDIKYIILNIPKKSVISSPDNPFRGIILPKYPSERLKNNLDQILSQLKEKGVI